MLSELSGRTHHVYTGLCVMDAITGASRRRVVSSAVCFRKLAAGEIKAYIATGEPMDKAGAYAIQGQGAGLVKSVSGDFTNIVGLPLETLRQMLADFGIHAKT